MLSERVSLNNIPDHLLEEICLRVADHKFSDIGSLELVSKGFKNHANSNYVLRRCSMAKLPFSRASYEYPLLWDAKSLRHLFKRLMRFHRAGIVEALYRTRLQKYFSQKSSGRRRQREFKQLGDAANKGNIPARYIYGLILLCYGGESKQKGFNMLSCFIKPMLSHTMEETRNISKSIQIVFWMGRETSMELIRNYVRVRCKFGKNILLPRGRGGDDYGDMSDKLISTSTLFHICLWDREITHCLHFGR